MSRSQRHCTLKYIKTSTTGLVTVTYYVHTYTQRYYVVHCINIVIIIVVIISTRFSRARRETAIPIAFLIDVVFFFLSIFLFLLDRLIDFYSYPRTTATADFDDRKLRIILAARKTDGNNLQRDNRRRVKRLK